MVSPLIDLAMETSVSDDWVKTGYRAALTRAHKAFDMLA
jgi:hypothetical protein